MFKDPRKKYLECLGVGEALTITRNTQDTITVSTRGSDGRYAALRYIDAGSGATSTALLAMIRLLVKQVKECGELENHGDNVAFPFSQASRENYEKQKTDESVSRL